MGVNEFSAGECRWLHSAFSQQYIRENPTWSSLNHIIPSELRGKNITAWWGLASKCSRWGCSKPPKDFSWSPYDKGLFPLFCCSSWSLGYSALGFCYSWLCLVIKVRVCSRICRWESMCVCVCPWSLMSTLRMGILIYFRDDWMNSRKCFDC